VSGYYSVEIGNGYEGAIRVVVAAGGIEQEFYLDVVPLARFVADPADREGGEYFHFSDDGLWLGMDGNRFIADSWLWRILNRNLGNSGAVLILSEYNYANGQQWHNAAATSTTEARASYVYTTTLPSYYSELGWAHSYAYVPDTSPNNSWGAVNNNQSETTGAPSAAPASSSDAKALFLLSYGDLNNNNGFTSNNARMAYSIHSTKGASVTPGSAVTTGTAYWLRNKQGNANAFYINATGGFANVAANTTTNVPAVRPAMILRFE
jgi:hypothetical protein